jgi:hypothetical protein
MGSSPDCRLHTAADVAELQLLFSTSCLSALQRKGAFEPRTFRKTAARAASHTAADLSTGHMPGVLDLSLSSITDTDLNSRPSTGSNIWQQTADDSAAGWSRNLSCGDQAGEGQVADLTGAAPTAAPTAQPALSVDGLESQPSVVPASNVSGGFTGGLKQLLKKVSSKSRADDKSDGSNGAGAGSREPSAATVESAQQLTARTGSLVYM